ncbi:MAG: hypothetical protein L3K19_01105 [Thermoplasmata archaeon]|nr:hypothetical protein [Thermoplasmata archaeon]
MPYYQLRVCSTGGAFEAVPRPRHSLDLKWVREKLEAEQIPVTDARVMLVIRLEREVTVSRDGRMLIKSRDSAEAATIFARLQRLLDLPEVVAED